MQYINDRLKTTINCSIYFVKENIDDNSKNLASLVAESVSHNILISQYSHPELIPWPLSAGEAL
jgi:hypothetical protein